MKIGYPNNPRHELEKEIAWAKEHDFDYVELYIEEGKTSPSSVSVASVSALLHEFPCMGSGHIPWYLPFGSPVKSVRKAAVSEAERYFEVFAGVGINAAAVHAHWCGGGFSAKEMISFQNESLHSLMDMAAGYGIRILFELTDRKQDSPENIRQILASCPSAGFLLDTGHANVCGRKPSDYLKILADRISHVHLHDNFRDMDLHLPVGCGNIDWEHFLKHLRSFYDGTVTLEIFSKYREYILFSREKVLKYWNQA